MSAPGADRRVTLSIDAGVAHVTLNRPRKRNALSVGLVTELSGILARIAGDHDVRVVALGGAGPDFCAGADLAEVAASEARELGNVLAKIRRLPQPVAAVVRGRALGGGCGLAAACDIVLAHEAATFGFPEVRLGFVPALVMAVLKRKVGEAAAFDLVVRGHRVGAAEAAGLGLITRVVSAESFGAEVRAYLAELATRPPLAVRMTKELFHGLDGAAFEEALARGAEVNAVARLTDECRDGVRRFLGRETGGG